ncbi:ABC transporter permease [Streptomyces sp. MAR4 CNX-425]|uniref:ABC transporter permease n=1 Tax=Streptomyces sp. MAR4 CNX-425 TaxID=3406343 RepID=UPI003B5133F9
MMLPVNGTLAAVLGALLAAAVAVAAAARLGEGHEHRRPGQGTGNGGPGEGGGKDRFSRWGSPHARAVTTAGLRAALQLAVVSVVIGYVVRAVPLLLAFVGLMFAVAAWTAGHRITHNRTWRWAAAPIAAGVAPVVATLLLTGLVGVDDIALIPVSGILIGGALTGTVLAGRRALDELAARHGEVEAALALGFPDHEARLEIARPAASDALIPGLDQTRTVGLVTLPGAYVGMLLGGSSPVEAGAVQLFVLVALMAVQAVAVAVVLELVARGRVHRLHSGTSEGE